MTWIKQTRTKINQSFDRLFEINRFQTFSPQWWIPSPIHNPPRSSQVQLFLNSSCKRHAKQVTTWLQVARAVWERKYFFPLLTLREFCHFSYLNTAESLSFWMCTSSWGIGALAKLASLKHSYKQSAILRICGCLNRICPTSCLSMWHTSWFVYPSVLNITSKCATLIVLSQSSGGRSSRLWEWRWEQWEACASVWYVGFHKQTPFTLCAKNRIKQSELAVRWHYLLFAVKAGAWMLKMKLEHARSCHSE